MKQLEPPIFPLNYRALVKNENKEKYKTLLWENIIAKNIHSIVFVLSYNILKIIVVQVTSTLRIGLSPKKEKVSLCLLYFLMGLNSLRHTAQL